MPIVNEALTVLWKEGIHEKFEMTHDLKSVENLGIKNLPAMTLDGKILFEGDFPGLSDMTNLLREKLKKSIKIEK